MQLVAHGPLEPRILVRVQAPEPSYDSSLHRAVRAADWGGRLNRRRAGERDSAAQSPRTFAARSFRGLSPSNSIRSEPLLPAAANAARFWGTLLIALCLRNFFEEERPEIVIHAAACKHVPLMERIPIATVRNNTLGTNQLAKMASAHGTRALVMVSTDKAVNPHSIMGATKRVAELALLRWSSARSPMGAVRLGNVLGSQGSVVPTFVKQIAEGGPVTVTHPEVSRYFFSMTETVDLLISAASLHDGGGIFVPDPGKPVNILALAEQLIRETAVGREIPIVITGLRPGDKMSEEFISERESFGGEPRGKLRLVHTPQPSHPIFDVAIEKANALRRTPRSCGNSGDAWCACAGVPTERIAVESMQRSRVALPMKRKIAVVTSSRADYSHLYWPLRDLSASNSVDLRLVVDGPASFSGIWPYFPGN